MNGRQGAEDDFFRSPYADMAVTTVLLFTLRGRHHYGRIHLVLKKLVMSRRDTEGAALLPGVHCSGAFPAAPLPASACAPQAPGLLTHLRIQSVLNRFEGGITATFWACSLLV